MFGARKLRKAKELFELKQYERAIQVMESLPTFAQDNDEGQWKTLSSGKAVYSEEDIQKMQVAARDMYYKNPLARGIIETIINFTIGKECQITAGDDNEVVQEYWDEFCKVNKFDQKSKEIVRRSLRDGESFVRFFEPVDGGDGKVPLIRFVEPDEISDKSNKHSYGIETDTDDIEKVVNYHRTYIESNNTIQEEVIPAEDIIHTKIKVDSNVKRGISFFVGIASYITKYKLWLDDRIVLNKLRTMYNLIGKPTGTSPSDLASKFSDVTGKTSTGGTAKKKLPKSGSVLLTTGVEWEFKNLNINASDTAADGRAILLMIVAGSNLAEYMVTGDSSNSNFASTMVSESPAVKAFEAHQDTYEKVYKEIYTWVITYGISKGYIPEESDSKCQVEFPILIHRDMKDETESLQIQRVNNWVSNQTASAKLGYNYKEEQEQIELENSKLDDIEKQKEIEYFNKVHGLDKDKETNNEKG